jgi:hypothetical protein
MGNPAQAITEAIEEHMGSWTPASGMELYETLMALPGLFEAIHDALGGVVERVSEAQGIPGWFEASNAELLKSVRAAAEQAAAMDEEFHKAYSFFLTTDDAKTRRRGRRR